MEIELLKHVSGLGHAAVGQCGGERAFVAAGHADQAGRILIEIGQRGRCLRLKNLFLIWWRFGRPQRSGILRCSQLHTGHQPAEILVSLTRRAKQRHARRGRLDVIGIARQQGSDLCPNMGFELELLHRKMKTRCAIDTVAVEHGHGRHFVCLANLGELLGNRSSFEKAESRAGVKLDVHVLGRQS